MKTKYLAGAAAATAMTLAMAGSAAAATFILDVSDVASLLGPGPYGQIDVNEVGSDLTFEVSLLAGFRFHELRGNNHDTFAFNLVGNPLIHISGLTTGFKSPGGTAGSFDLAAGNFVEAGFGTFDYALECPRGGAPCNPGFAGGHPGPLEFTVHRVDNVALTLDDFANAFNTVTIDGTYDNINNPQTYQIYATADLINTVGKTGNVGAVPEPATWALLLAGFGLIGFAMRRRPKDEAAYA